MADERPRGSTGRLHVGYGFTEPCEGPGCWYCADGWAWARWDHGVWRALAATLAQPLRDAFVAHLDGHGCGDPGSPIGGFGYCPDAMALYELLPDGDRICIA